MSTQNSMNTSSSASKLLVSDASNTENSKEKNKIDDSNNNQLVVGATKSLEIQQQQDEKLKEQKQHELQSCWSLYYFKYDKDKDWIDTMQLVDSFASVEAFWSTVHHVAVPSRLPGGTNYYLFKRGIQPMWEDPANKRGGQWLINVDRGHRNLIDLVWIEIIMLMIREGFGDASDDVCGAVVSLRSKGDRVTLWTRDAKNEFVNMQIGCEIKAQLGVKSQIVYQSHEDTSSRIGSRTRILYQI